MDKPKNKKLLILKKVGVFLGTIILLLVMCKFALFFMPFLIAGIIAILIEPIIKFFMNKLKFSRRVSSVIVVSITIVLLVFITFWGGSGLVSWLIKLIKNITPTMTNITLTINRVVNVLSNEFTDVPIDVVESIQSSLVDFIGQLGTYVGSFASSTLKIVLSLPTVIVNVIITILALIFFTKDRIYVIDLLEYHFPKTWLMNAGGIIKEVGHYIGGYIKVYFKIILITFTELFLAFGIMNLIGLYIEHPLLYAVLIVIVDILPILGVGTVLIPWAIYMLIIGNFGFALALLIVYVVIFCVRQFIEPKLVSTQFGIHPILTLMAMYAGFRLMGVTGLIVGPIFLMVLRCIFAPQIEKGLFKDMFDEK